MIVGLGKTGLSCARYFASHGIAFAVMDDNPAPASLPDLKALAPGVLFGAIDEAGLAGASQIVLSPGVPLSRPEIQSAIQSGVPVTGDIAMFSELADAPIVAITGSNGKSTVTAMVGAIAGAVGINAGVGGNIGIPSFDLLEKGHSLFVLEVSSYQLELARRIKAKVATVLNLSPDHLDRYDDALAYFETKASIYKNCEVAVLCREVMHPFDLSGVERVITFGAGEPEDETGFGLRVVDGETWLCQGERMLMACSELSVRGSHNHLNALAALSIGFALGWDLETALTALRTFEGLPHRCEFVALIDGVEYINDSKSTNIGSTLAAINGLSGEAARITLILGGQGKGADFTSLVPTLRAHVGRVLVYGKDRDLIARQLGAATKAEVFVTLEEVVHTLKQTTIEQGLVLFSPGCASLDQFRNFEHRGDVFKQLVTGLEVAS